MRGGVVGFEKSSTAANSTIICEGGSSPSTGGGAVEFFDNASAASATITAKGGSTSGAGGGLISFISGQTASSTLIVNGGIEGGLGAQLLILGTPEGGSKATGRSLRQRQSQPFPRLCDFRLAGR